MRPYGGFTSGNPCGPSPHGPRLAPGPSVGAAPRPNCGVGKKVVGPAGAPAPRAPRPPPKPPRAAAAAGAPAACAGACGPPGPAGPAFVGPACGAGPAARPPVAAPPGPPARPPCATSPPPPAPPM